MKKYIVKIIYQVYTFDYSHINDVIDYIEANFVENCEVERINLFNGFYSNAKVFNNKTEATKAAKKWNTCNYMNYSFELITL